MQQAVRFGLFHILQAGARAEQRPIPAKGLTGPGYDGHTFWDTETFVLPVLTYTQPDGGRRRPALAPADAADRPGAGPRAGPRRRRLPVAHDPGPGVLGLLAGRHRRLPHQRRHRRRRRALRGRHRRTSEFEREVGVELLVDTARLWRSLGHHDPDGPVPHRRRHGPDEYSAIADNNVYTNLMAQQNLRAAAGVCARARPTGPTAGRDDGGDGVVARRGRRDGRSPTTSELGVHPQSERLHRARALGLRGDTPPDQYPLLLHFPYFDLYRKQVVKQADLVLAMHLRGDAFTPSEKDRNFGYYEALTVRDSSLSACTQAVVAAELGHLDLAYDYLAEAALMDLRGPGSATPATACTWRRWRARGPRWSRASAACGPATGTSASRRGCRPASAGWRSGCATGAAPSWSPPTARRHLPAVDGPPCTIAAPRRGGRLGDEAGRDAEADPARRPPAPAAPAAGPRAGRAGGRGASRPRAGIRWPAPLHRGPTARVIR